MGQLAGSPSCRASRPVGLLGQDQPGDPQDRRGVLTGGPQQVDRAVFGAAGHDQPGVVSDHDAGPACAGRPGSPARRPRAAAGRAARPAGGLGGLAACGVPGAGGPAGLCAGPDAAGVRARAAARRRRRITRTGSVRNAVAVSRAAAASMAVSQPGMPAACAARPGRGRLPCVPGGGQGGSGWPGPGPGGGPGGAGRPDRGGRGAAGAAAGRGMARMVPGRIRAGSGPMTRRLAAYRAGQPAAHRQRRRDRGQGVPGRHGILGRRRRPGQRQHRARVNHIRGRCR